MDIKILESKADQLLALVGISQPKITEEQKQILAEYIEQIKDPLIDGFFDAQIPSQFSAVIEDINEGVKFRLTLKKL